MALLHLSPCNKYRYCPCKPLRQPPVWRPLLCHFSRRLSRSPPPRLQHWASAIGNTRQRPLKPTRPTRSKAAAEARPVDRWLSFSPAPPDPVETAKEARNDRPE